MCAARGAGNQKGCRTTGLMASPRPIPRAPKPSSVAKDFSRARRAQRSMGWPPVSKLWPRCGTCRGPSELVSQTITSWDGNETMAREVSPWTPRCADPWCQSRRLTTAFEGERHARLRALSRSVGTADGVPGHGSVSVACQLCCQSRRGLARSARQPHTAGCLQRHSQTTGSAHHSDRRTQHGPRRAPRAA